MVGIPIPSRMEMNMAKISASNWLVAATSSNSTEKRAPTPVSEITPTITPAAAHTTIIWIAI